MRDIVYLIALVGGVHLANEQVAPAVVLIAVALTLGLYPRKG